MLTVHAAVGLHPFYRRQPGGGFAVSGAALLAARAVQGLGAAVLATSPLAIIVAAPPPKGPGQERAIGMFMVLALGAILTSSLFFLSQTLQRIDGRNPLDTGLALLPMAASLAVAAISSRTLRDLGVRHLPCLGGLISAAGLIWLYWIPEHPNLAADLLIPTLLLGTGCGLVMMSATHAVLAGVPRQDAGLAAGLQNSARQLGGAIGIALLVTLAHAVTASRNAAGQAARLAELDGYRCAFLAAGCLSILAALASLLLRGAASEPAPASPGQKP
ncbi:MFS transporter [Kerstersia sp.]|uniref:MFS transporter n=1 Tax=Kerstersia sp. TaxID=1930783 RepID=UPI003F93C7EF